MEKTCLHSTRTLAAALLAIGLSYSAPASADPISDRFDGVYAGEIRLNRAISTGDCSTLSLTRVEISEGNMWGYDSDGTRVARGWVTEDGFFTGEFELPSGKRAGFEGVVDEDGVFTGGIVEKECAWLADLKQKRGEDVT